MRIGLTGVVLLWVAAPAGLVAQEPDSAPQAYGVYPAGPPATDTAAPADTGAAPAPAATTPGVVTVPPEDTTLRRDTATARDTMAARDTTAVRDDAAQGRQVAGEEELSPDTSLTARMDVRRGGGLTRSEFPDIWETARLTGRYSVFLELLGSEIPGAPGGAVTLLAPTDSAFARLGPAVRERLRGDSALRQRWRGSVVLEGDHSAAELTRAGEVVSVGGDTLRFARRLDGPLRVGGARVVQADLVARNGRLHGLDRVFLPGGPVSGPTSAAP